MSGLRACVKCGTMFEGRYCKACKKAIAKAYYATNPEKLKERTNNWRDRNPEAVKAIRRTAAARNPGKQAEAVRAWREANPEKAKASAKRYKENHPEKIKERMASWRERNPDARSLHESNRRARASGERLSRDIQTKLFALQRGKCPCCKQPLGKDYHLDHKMPLALGGSNTDDNMQLLRGICNMKKHASHPVDYMQKQGFLL